MEEKDPLEGTIFEDYDTIIFDLDFTIVDCYTPDGTGIGAFQTTPPFKLKDRQTVLDLYGRVIRLQDGVLELLELLDKHDVNMGLLSRSEVKDMLFDAQPAIMILKKFDIYKYFNYEVVLKMDMLKANYIKPLGKTLFIDDDKTELDQVNFRGDVDVLWRRAFVKWETLLEPKNQSLSFNNAQPLVSSLEDKDRIIEVASRYLGPLGDEVNNIEFWKSPLVQMIREELLSGR
jgi:predicted phosphatase